MQGKTHRILPVGAEKAFDKLQHSFIIIRLRKRFLKEHISILKVQIWGKHAKIIFNSEKMKTLPVRSGGKNKYPLSTPLFKIVLNVVNTAITEDKDRQVFQIGKGE